MLVYMSGDRDSLRASDFDREFVVEQLRDALDEGRLDLSEYDDRVRGAYAAKTYGELREPLDDLSEGVLLPIDDGPLDPVRAVEAQRGAMLAVVIFLAILVAVVVLVGQVGGWLFA